MEVDKPMTVADLIVRLSEMDPTLEIVVPQAPYGQPTPVFHGFVSVISIDSDELAGEYCGVGFSEEDYDRYCESDDLEPLDEEEEETRWHDKSRKVDVINMKAFMHRFFT